ncbi:MAG TPA: phosphorylase [Leptolyngbya sp.]|jgi:hypothetical protein|nr:phosphorylase [Leptolyngbya sp.]
MVSVILVPQGAEYQAVYQGIRSRIDSPQVVPIPAGSERTFNFDRFSNIDNILVMGLCGSLSPRFEVGAIALYRSCLNISGSVKDCDRALTQRLQNQLQVSPVVGLMSDRVICLAAEKRDLGKAYGAEVVDMEGFAILSQIPVAMLRVVSDGIEGDLPDLSGVISDGKVQTLPMVKAMIRTPIAATRLIRGSLTGLKKLRQLAASLSF